MKKGILSLAVIASLAVFASCSSSTAACSDSDSAAVPKDMKGGGIKLGAVPNGGPVIDKSNDTTLQRLIKEVVPEFKQLEYADKETGKTIKYNLLSPKNVKAGEKYPMVLFIADASTPGADPLTPLTQGYGALVWGTDKWQSQHPCYVLVPQFSGIATDDEYQHTDEADAVIRLVNKLAAENPVDTDRLYTTGQSMGGMLSMYYNVQYPDFFAASIFVDSHWAADTFPELVKHKFIWFIAGKSGKSYAKLNALEEACDKEDIKYTFTEWSAKLDRKEQDDIANKALSKGDDVNIFMFTPGSVLPVDGKGSEHMYSFDCAYNVKAARQWLFKQKK